MRVSDYEAEACGAWSDEDLRACWDVWTREMVPLITEHLTGHETWFLLDDA